MPLLPSSKLIALKNISSTLFVVCAKEYCFSTPRVLLYISMVSLFWVFMNKHINLDGLKVEKQLITLVFLHCFSYK